MREGRGKIRLFGYLDIWKFFFFQVLFGMRKRMRMSRVPYRSAAAPQGVDEHVIGQNVQLLLLLTLHRQRDRHEAQTV